MLAYAGPYSQRRLCNGDPVQLKQPAATGGRIQTLSQLLDAHTNGFALNVAESRV
jgi:hypothetical protein